MTIALQLVRWRRVAALCAATLLVHYLAAGWVDGGGAPQAAVRESAPVAVSIQLRPPAPVLPDLEASAAVPEPQVQSDNSAAPVAQPPAPAGRYRADVPPAAQLTYVLVRTGAAGPAETGEAALDWTRAGTAGTYRLHYVSGIASPVREQLAELASEGIIGVAGIIPRTMTQQRRGRSRTATHFAERGNISFSASGQVVPMQAGAQDLATWPLQLSAIARAGIGQLATGVVMLVGEERGASMYRVEVLGQEDLVTGVGALATWRLARVPAAGSYNARLDIWLAPGHEWFPVQLRSTEANGTVTTQTIRKIVVTDAGN